jgi:hypothetical protein
MANKTNTQQVYCLRIITVAEVWDYTFGDKCLPVGVKQLSFQCSVEGCTANRKKV